jgi:hypothetical protein
MAIALQCAKHLCTIRTSYFLRTIGVPPILPPPHTQLLFPSTLSPSSAGPQISFTPHSCPFTSPCRLSHLTPLHLQLPRWPAPCEQVPCSTSCSAPAAVLGTALLSCETPTLVTSVQFDRHPPPQMISNIEVFDDQGNLRLSAVRNGLAAGLGETGARESTFTYADPSAIGDLEPQGGQIPYRLPAVPMDGDRVPLRDQGNPCELLASTLPTTPRIITHTLKTSTSTMATQSTVTMTMKVLSPEKSPKVVTRTNAMQLNLTTTFLIPCQYGMTKLRIRTIRTPFGNRLT